jgi:hypothetical protein
MYMFGMCFFLCKLWQLNKSTGWISLREQTNAGKDVRKEGTLYTVVGMLISAATIAISIEAPQKSKNRATI